MVPGVTFRHDKKLGSNHLAGSSQPEKRAKGERGKNAATDDGHDDQVIDNRPPPTSPDEDISRNTIRLSKDPAPNLDPRHDPDIYRTDYNNELKSTKKPPSTPPSINQIVETVSTLARILTKFARFVGPGFLVSVAYIDPGNYSTDAAAGAAARFKLLFVVLLSNIFAVFLQSLCVKLGSVTGLNLAEMCRRHLPRWLNVLLYIFAEAAIIATDIAEVIGSAIALNLLLHIPLVAGCAITLVDVLLILLLYRPTGSLQRLRVFEFFVLLLIIGVFVCFSIQLSLIRGVSAGEVFRGYLPSSAVVQGNGLYLSCGILGATVMPHSLYLGSGLVQPRMRDYDIRQGYAPEGIEAEEEDGMPKYRPSLKAIRYSLSYSVVETILSLLTFALFINSAILIVAGALQSSDPSVSDGDLFGIYRMLSTSLSPVAGTIFALALFFSGTSAGIICTIAGQMVSEGALNWRVTPWIRRLVTRALAILPSIVIAGAVGKEGLTNALNGTQVALSIILPFVSAPLVYFTCRTQYMTVPATSRSTLSSTSTTSSTSIAMVPSESREPTGLIDGGEGANGQNQEGMNMKNGWLTTILAVLIWLFIATMNVALLVRLGMGQG